MKSLRLLVHETCNRYCKLCCNQSGTHNLNDLAQVSPADFMTHQEVLLTGGEPMIDPLKLIDIAHIIWGINPDLDIYLYTAKCRPPATLIAVLMELDGITLTLHDQKDVQDFVNLQAWLERMTEVQGKSLRLNYFNEDVDLTGVNTLGWDLQPMKWFKDCPLPSNETFRRWEGVTRQERNYRKAFHAFNNISTMDA